MPLSVSQGSKIFVTNVSVKFIGMDRDGMLTKQRPSFSEGHESKQMLLLLIFIAF
jgi:hypothetical protein